ncbi:MAG TPA: penicillin-binding protein activator, partial [Xanthomonadales bacterium]|nr:penicillin-binding protein activator [Xanthomonadales bacterium]
GDIPVYASSRIYSGQPDKSRDQDLNGIIFPASPLQIHFAAMRSTPPAARLKSAGFTPLYALGRDAWNILPWLEMLRTDADFRFPGQSGTYASGAGPMLQREPEWAVFRNGIPVKWVNKDARNGKQVGSRGED